MKHARHFIAPATFAALVFAGAAHADIWVEVGDAGQNGPAQAQVPFGVGQLTEIQGELNPGNDVDVYLINITDYQNFVMYGNGPLDTMLFLFNADGTGQVANDDYFGDFGGQLTSLGLTHNGLYYIGITRFNNRPVDAGGNLIFDPNSFYGGDPAQSQLMPFANAGAFDHWTGTANGDGGLYKLRFGGATYAPAPGALALLGLAGIAGRRRRRAM